MVATMVPADPDVVVDVAPAVQFLAYAIAVAEEVMAILVLEVAVVVVVAAAMVQ